MHDVTSSSASGAELLAQNADPSVLSVTKARLHLPYLDGIRALMALYVMHHHLLTLVGVKNVAFRWSWSELLMPLYQAHDAVVVFIVLSGYCLMLPVLRDGGALRGGSVTFFRRRARRILPAYYAALFGGVVAELVVNLLAHAYAFTPEVTSLKRWLLHIFLLHNLSWEHIYEYNGALWSIATEWQIYFLFPFLFLPIWKRWGETALLVAGLTLGAVLTLLFPSIAKACPWFVALFAVGMVAAKWSLAPTPRLQRVPWLLIAVVITLATYIALRLIPAINWAWGHQAKGRLGFFPLPDIALGIATLCFLMHGTRATIEGRRGAFVSLFTWRPLVFVGAFSYSLYLIHIPLQLVPLRIILRYQLSPLQSYAALMLLYVPLTLVCAYGFYLVFEKPFLRAASAKTSSIA